MIRVVFALTARTYYWLADYAPTNRLVRRVRTRPTLGGCGVALLAGVGCLLAAVVVTGAVRSGAPEWLNIAVLVLCYDAIKLGVLAPIGLAWTLKARLARPRATARA